VVGCLIHGLCFLSPPGQVLVAWLAVVNFAGLVMMCYDKSQTRSGDRRVREMTLWKVAFIGGAFGILAGESAFHHKTKDLTFMAPVSWPWESGCGRSSGFSGRRETRWPGTPFTSLALQFGSQSVWEQANGACSLVRNCVPLLDSRCGSGVHSQFGACTQPDILRLDVRQGSIDMDCCGNWGDFRGLEVVRGLPFSRYHANSLSSSLFLASSH
jgi:uncharacterized membrane protein YsdA (DUF1294 family)